ncbi:CLUMA_CG015144, isoform A [Clunio marinus]|uniref:26S proteasome complex subunit SEM1 n=1 Tax=Clunio marinus TaxID=568069 RepID=A0A1J1IP89_9DIPT|nr:CLUMA_CG015144, isoform A [Clunio marinus]
MADKEKEKAKVDLGLLEEDDEFEEFPAEDWVEAKDADEEELSVWEDNWDDDNLDNMDDFSEQSIRILSKNLPISLVRPLCSIKMSVNARLEAIPIVEIDEGTFKYVLIKVYGKEQCDGSEHFKLIVRGFERASWHTDIYDEVSSALEALGLETECLGGGRIAHNPSTKPEIKVYGYSQGFGKADHEQTRKLLLTKYHEYSIECSDEGY